MSHLLSLQIPGADGQSVEIQAPDNIPTGGLTGGGGKIIGAGLTIFLFVAILLAFGFAVYGGLNWITSEGDKTKVQSARRTITYALIGIIVCFLSFFVMNLVGTALKVDFFKLSL